MLTRQLIFQFSLLVLCSGSVEHNTRKFKATANAEGFSHMGAQIVTYKVGNGNIEPTAK